MKDESTNVFHARSTVQEKDTNISPARNTRTDFFFLKGTIVSHYGKFIANYQRFRYTCIQIHTNARMHTRKQAHTSSQAQTHRHTSTKTGQSTILPNTVI